MVAGVTCVVVVGTAVVVVVPSAGLPLGAVWLVVIVDWLEPGAAFAAGTVVVVDGATAALADEPVTGGDTASPLPVAATFGWAVRILLLAAD